MTPSLATYALLISKDLRTVQELLGHRTITQTSKYAHVLMFQKVDVVDKTIKFVSDITRYNDKIYQE
jgi:site-specific recombinase XerC